MDVIGFTPILNATWIPCEECDGTANGLGSAPRLHKGVWYARDGLGRPLFWGLGQDTTDPPVGDSPGNDPTIVSGSTGDIQNSDNGVLSPPPAVTSVQSTTPGGGVSPQNVSSTSTTTTTTTSGGGSGSSGGGAMMGASGGATDYIPWLIGGAAVAGAGIIGYAWWRKKHHR